MCQIKELIQQIICNTYYIYTKQRAKFCKECKAFWNKFIFSVENTNERRPVNVMYQLLSPTQLTASLLQLPISGIGSDPKWKWSFWVVIEVSYL